MSKIRNDYDNTKWAKFLGWVNGTVGDEIHLDTERTVVAPTQSKSKNELHSVHTDDKSQAGKINNYQEYVRKFNRRLMKFYNVFYKVAAVVICLSIISILIYTVSFLPHFGDPSNPGNNEVAQRYIEKGLQETGAVNIVTGMILDYRAFDTFGESNVLYLSACAVLVLLRIDSKGKNKTKEQEDAEESDRIYEPKNDLILQKIATLVIPPIIIFGIYVVLNGHISPGGGFSGGAIIGAGLILYLNAFGFKKTERFFTMKTFMGISFGALAFYALSKSYSFFTGANHLESHIPLGTPGNILSSGLILPLNICVGLVVACTMYGFYALFRKGDL